MVDGTGEYHRGAEHLKSIEEVCLRVTSGGTPSRRNPSYYKGGRLPWLKTQELQDGWLDDSEEHITDHAVASSSAQILPANTVLMAMYGATVGQLGILRRPMTCNQACCAMIVDPGQADYRYLFYQLLHARPRIKSLSTGAAQQNLSGRLIKSLKFSFPSLSEQRAIAHILGTLDDKIELNRRMNETLEAMARALFKSWFVDFDPVRAKMEGRHTGLPQDIADLFPDRLVHSEMGKIPEWWEVASLGTVIEIHDRKRIPLNKHQRAQRQGPYPYYGAAGIMDYVNDFLFDGVYVLSGEDGSVVDAHGHPVVQYVWGKFWVNNHAHVLKGRKDISEEHLYLLLQGANITAFVTGAVQPKLNQRNLKAIPLVLPTGPACRVFSGLVAPLFARVRHNADESERLVALRETLLPKLISGEIRVGDAEMALESVT